MTTDSARPVGQNKLSSWIPPYDGGHFACGALRYAIALCAIYY
jgi:hypothetical protein